MRAALYVLGHNLTEASLRRRSGTTTEGTDEKGIMRAVRYYGHDVREYNSNCMKKSWSWLKSMVGRGKPVLLCSDNWNHWIVVVGKLGGKVLVFDPDSSAGKRKIYSGLKVFNEYDLGLRWEHFDEDTYCSSYYAIAVTP